jgi:hypothetical protein
MTQDIRGIDGVERIIFIGQFFRRIVLFEFHEVADLLIFGQRIRRFHAYSGEREHPYRLNVNAIFLNASPTGVCTPGVHVQSIS